MKRRWFQIHLSTAVVLMFAAGGLLHLNFYVGAVRASDPKLTQPSAPVYEYGWPFPAMFTQVYEGPPRWDVEGKTSMTRCEIDGRQIKYTTTDKATGRVIKNGIEHLSGPALFPFEMALNAVSAALMLVLLALALERRLHAAPEQ